MEESSVVFPAIFYYSIFSNVSAASEWSWRSVQCPTPLPPVPSVSTIPEESDFLYCSISCWTKRTLYTSRLALCLVSGVSWRTDFLRCSGTSGPCNRTCMIGYTFELLLFLFLIFLNSFPMPASERATSPPLFEEEWNSKLPKREMSFSVPSFCAAFILSMGSFLQVTFFIDKIKQTRKYHVRKQLRHNVKSNYKASTQNHPSPNNNPPSIIFSLLDNTKTTHNIALLELEIKYFF